MSTPIRGLSPAEYFRDAPSRATMTAAHRATGIAYSTIHRASRGTPLSAPTAEALSAWSRTVDRAGIVIDAALAAGIAPPPAKRARKAVSE